MRTYMILASGSSCLLGETTCIEFTLWAFWGFVLFRMYDALWSLFCICLLLISFHSVILGKYHSSSAPEVDNEDHSNHHSEEETTERILQHENTAAAVLSQMKMHYGTQASLLQVTQDVLGIVASLGKVEDENLSRLVWSYFQLHLLVCI